jgi:hypothetical protein
MWGANNAFNGKKKSSQSMSKKNQDGFRPTSDHDKSARAENAE